MFEHRPECIKDATPLQIEALLNIFTFDHDGCDTFTQFVDRCTFDALDNVLFVRWRGQTVGIEANGYKHT